MKTRLISIGGLALAFTAVCSADVFVFQDLNDIVTITDNGVLLTGNGGRVSNFVILGESISFDLTAPGVAQIAASGFTNLLDPASSDDPGGTVSDRFVEVFGPIPFTTYHVAFGSDPNLPVIPAGATDLTTIPAQGLPANPYFENGTVQKVGSSFQSSGVVLDTFFIQSDLTDLPEPRLIVPIMLIVAGLIVRVARSRQTESGHCY
jgi:hypothetical protein